MSILTPKHGRFPITSVHRGDLEAAGFDASSVDDGVMLDLAEKMAGAYLDSAFWVDLDLIAEALGIPKRVQPEGSAAGDCDLCYEGNCPHECHGKALND